MREKGDKSCLNNLPRGSQSAKKHGLGALLKKVYNDDFPRAGWCDLVEEYFIDNYRIDPYLAFQYNVFLNDLSKRSNSKVSNAIKTIGLRQKKKNNKHDAENRDILSTSYIRGILLRKLDKDDITNDLISDKRLHLIFFRLIKLFNDFEQGKISQQDAKEKFDLLNKLRGENNVRKEESVYQ